MIIRILAILLIATQCHAGTAIVARRPAAAFCCSGADIVEDFEDAVTGWTATDPSDCGGGAGACLDTQAAGYDSTASRSQAGSLGMSIDTGGTTGGVTYYSKDTWSDADDTFSIGFWFKAADVSQTYTMRSILNARINNTSQLMYGKVAAGNHSVRFGAGTEIELTVGNWYWVTCYFARAGTNLLRVYASNGVQIGGEQSAAADDLATTYINIGALGAWTGNDGVLGFDDIVIYNDATWPITP